MFCLWNPSHQHKAGESLLLQGLLPLPAVRLPLCACACVCVCTCAQLTHCFEGGVLVESHCAVVAVCVRKSLSKGSVGGVVQMVLFCLDTSRHMDGVWRLWLGDKWWKPWAKWNRLRSSDCCFSEKWRSPRCCSAIHAQFVWSAGNPATLKMHHDGAQLIKHVSSLEFAPRHQVGPAVQNLVRHVQWIHLHSLQRSANVMSASCLWNSLKILSRWCGSCC